VVGSLPTAPPSQIFVKRAFKPPLLVRAKAEIILALVLPLGPFAHTSISLYACVFHLGLSGTPSAAAVNTPVTLNRPKTEQCRLNELHFTAIDVAAMAKLMHGPRPLQIMGVVEHFKKEGQDVEHPKFRLRLIFEELPPDTDQHVGYTAIR